MDDDWRRDSLNQDTEKVLSENETARNKVYEDILLNKEIYLKIIRRKCLWTCPNKENCCEALFCSVLTTAIENKQVIKNPIGYFSTVAPQFSERRAKKCNTCNPQFQSIERPNSAKEEDELQILPDELIEKPQTEQIFYAALIKSIFANENNTFFNEKEKTLLRLCLKHKKETGKCDFQKILEILKNDKNSLTPAAFRQEVKRVKDKLKRYLFGETEVFVQKAA